eukprot:9265578-Ditylum_brightwellii.AAC.1
MSMWQSSGLYLAAPIAVALGDQGHGSPGTNSHIGPTEDIYLTNKNAHQLNSNHNTTSMSYSEGSSNGNVNSKNISTLSREPPHIAREETPNDFIERSSTTNTGDSSKKRIL